MKTFQLLLKPVSADCNNRCGYCFYRPVEKLYPNRELSQRRMALEILEQVIRELMSQRLPQTIFCWQGGEPTLAGLDFFAEVIRLEQTYGRPGQVVGNALQTNGLLLDEEWAKFLARYRFVVGLSVDGPEEVHSVYRGGTFDRVMAAAERLRSAGVAFNILTVVSPANVERAEEVYRFFRGQGFNHLQFVPCLEKDPAGRGLAPFSITASAYGKFLCELWEVWLKDGFPLVSIRDFDSYLSRRLKGKATLCTFQPTCGQYLVVEYNGDIYPCDFFVRPEFKLGNLGERPLVEFWRLDALRKFARAKSAPARECLSCPWRGYCHGGCQKDRLTADGQPAARSFFCSAYQTFFRHAEPCLGRMKDLLRGPE